MLMEAINWLIEHREGIINVILATHGVAVAVVNLTPTPYGHELVESIYQKVEWAAGIVSPKAKQ